MICAICKYFWLQGIYKPIKEITFSFPTPTLEITEIYQVVIHHQMHSRYNLFLNLDKGINYNIHLLSMNKFIQSVSTTRFRVYINQWRKQLLIFQPPTLRVFEIYQVVIHHQMHSIFNAFLNFDKGINYNVHWLFTNSLYNL